jgi:hypothetical protein
VLFDGFAQVSCYGAAANVHNINPGKMGWDGMMKLEHGYARALAGTYSDGLGVCQLICSCCYVVASCSKRPLTRLANKASPQPQGAPETRRAAKSLAIMTDGDGGRLCRAEGRGG